jgi:Phosphatidylserine synthase
MQTLYGLVVKGYLRLIEPVAALLIRHNVSPNAITTFGTICTLVGGGLYAAGHIMTAGWVIGLTALFDVLDGTVARRTGKSTVFGASTIRRSTVSPTAA